MAPGMYVIGNPDALPDTVHASVYAAISAIGLTLATADANASAVVIDIDATPDTLDADPLNVDAPVVRLAVAIGLTCALAETVLSAVVSAPDQNGYAGGFDAGVICGTTIATALTSAAEALFAGVIVKRT